MLILEEWSGTGSATLASRARLLPTNGDASDVLRVGRRVGTAPVRSGSTRDRAECETADDESPGKQRQHQWWEQHQHEMTPGILELDPIARLQRIDCQRSGRSLEQTVRD